MTFTNFGKTLSAGLFLASVMIAPGFAQDAAPSTPEPSGTGQVDQGGLPTAAPAETPSPNGESPVTSSETDKASGMIADTDVFGFDITTGTVNLTPEQRLAAENTCRDSVTAEPGRYSSNVLSFCDTLK